MPSPVKTISVDRPSPKALPPHQRLKTSLTVPIIAGPESPPLPARKSLQALPPHLRPTTNPTLPIVASPPPLLNRTQRIRLADVVTQAKPANPNKKSFLDLPGELRNKIYEMATKELVILDVRYKASLFTPPPPTTACALAQTCHQVLAESWKIGMTNTWVRFNDSWSLAEFSQFTPDDVIENIGIVELRFDIRDYARVLGMPKQFIMASRREKLRHARPTAPMSIRKKLSLLSPDRFVAVFSRVEPDLDAVLAEAQARLSDCLLMRPGGIELAFA